MPIGIEDLDSEQLPPELDFDAVIEVSGAPGSNFGVLQLDITPQTDLEPPPPGANEQVFLIPAHRLARALRAVSFTLGNQSDAGNVAVELMGNDSQPGLVTLETSSVWGRCKSTISTSVYGVRPGIGAKSARFRVNHKRLKDLCAQTDTNLVEFRLRLDRMRLTMVVSGRRVPLPIWTAYSSLAASDGGELNVREVDGALLMPIVKYLAAFSRRDDVESNWSVAEFGAYSAIAGTRAAVGMAKWTTTAIGPMSLPTASLLALVGLQVDLSGTRVRIADSDGGYQFSAEELQMWLPRVSTKFPGRPEPILAKQSGSLMVHRSSLIGALERLQFASQPHVSVKLPATDSDIRTMRLTLVTADGEWTDEVSCVHRGSDPSDGWLGTVPLHDLLQSIEHSDSVNLRLSYSGKAIVISSESPDGAISMTSLFGAVPKEVKVSQQQPASAQEDASAAMCESPATDSVGGLSVATDVVVEPESESSLPEVNDD